jgi:hypothetical protein
MKRSLILLCCLAVFTIAGYTQANSMPAYGQLRVVNQHFATGNFNFRTNERVADSNIVQIYIRENGKTDWGESYIDTKLAGNESTAITMKAGLYDVRIVRKNNRASWKGDEISDNIIRNILIRENYITEIICAEGIQTMPHKKMEGY